MWLFTKYGFFSATQHASRKDLIHLRSRFKGDLEKLFEASRTAVRGIMEGAEIETTINKASPSDLGFYCDVNREIWAAICAFVGNDIDYSYFDTCVEKGSGRAEAYGHVYETMRNARDRKW